MRCAYPILYPLGPEALSGNKKLKRRIVVIQKESVSWSFVHPNGTKGISCLVQFFVRNCGCNFATQEISRFLGDFVTFDP